MAADIDIINAALTKLGEITLLSVADVSPAGRLANRTYADIRDSFLRQYTWNFATKRASLAAESEAPEWGFLRTFNFPSDFLRLIEIKNEGDEDWRNEGNAIVTDIVAPLKIKYVARVLEGEMDATFREALAARLAMEWAEPLAQSTTLTNTMATLYRNKLQVARAADGQEDRIRVIEASDFINARF